MVDAKKKEIKIKKKANFNEEFKKNCSKYKASHTNENETVLRFTWKSAFFLIISATIMNGIFVPILKSLGIDNQLSFFLVNTIGLSTLYNYTLLVMNDVYKNPKQATLIIIANTAIITILAYMLIYADLS